MKPIVFDLFCGLGGWSEAFLAEGYHAIGFDIEAHDYGKGGYPGELVLADIRSLSGGELVKRYGVPAIIVASPPCQEFSYMAMPWSKAKEKMKHILASASEQKRLTDLFNQCFRIQREVSEAAGHHVPMIVENVRGAERWVGRARWKFGSFYLWGDVPALMPIHQKVIKYGAIGSERHIEMRGEGNKSTGLNWSDQTKRGQDFTRVAASQATGTKLPGNNSPRRWEYRDVKRLCDAGGKAMNIHMNYKELKEGVKGFTSNGEQLGKNTLVRMCSSKSKARKEASAIIAKIPFPLASWIAKTFKPKTP